MEKNRKRNIYIFCKMLCVCLCAQSCLTLCDPMDGSQPGSSVRGIFQARILAQVCPWNSLGKNTGVVCHFILQGIPLTQESNPGLLHCKQIPYHCRGTRGISNCCWRRVSLMGSEGHVHTFVTCITLQCIHLPSSQSSSLDEV